MPVDETCVCKCVCACDKMRGRVCDKMRGASVERHVTSVKCRGMYV